MANIGRPTKLTPALMAEVVKLVLDGNSLEAAADCVGVSDTCLYLWLAKGREGDETYVGFSDAVTRARGQAEVRAVAAMREGMLDDWKAAESWLKRARFRTWGDKQTVDVGKKEPTMDTSRLAPAEMLAYMELQLKMSTSDTERTELKEHISVVKGLLGA